MIKIEVMVFVTEAEDDRNALSHTKKYMTRTEFLSGTVYWSISASMSRYDIKHIHTKI